MPLCAYAGVSVYMYYHFHGCSDGEKDILMESLGENYKSIKKEALEVLYKSDIKVCQTEDSIQ